MGGESLLAIGTALLFQVTAIWLFLTFFNLAICSLPRSLVKIWLKKITLLATFPGLALFLYFYRNHPEVQSLLTWQEFHWAHGLTLALVAIALLCQIPVSWHIFQSCKLPGLVSRKTRKIPFHPLPGDWEVYKDESYSRQPVEGYQPPDATTPLPPYQRDLLPVRFSHCTTLMQLPPFKQLDQTYALQAREIQLTFPHFPAAFEGMRLLHLTDNHFGPLMPPRFFRHLTEQAMALRPDLIALTGDFTSNDHLYRQAVEVLADLEAPLGVYYVRGNHDFYSEPEILAWWMERQGFQLLSNEARLLEKEDSFLRLVGLEHPYIPCKKWESLVHPKDDPAAFRLVLTHPPDNFPRLARLGADLTLCGHTHGGQWRLPGLGALLYPSRYGRRFDRGFSRIGQSLLYCSPGTGVHTIPFRLHCPPEITLFVLGRTSQDPPR